MKWLELSADNSFLLAVSSNRKVTMFETPQDILDSHRRTLFRLDNKVTSAGILDDIAEINAYQEKAHFIFYNAETKFDELFDRVSFHQPSRNSVIETGGANLDEIEL